MGIYKNERWKAIEGFEGLYEISDHGRARSLDRIDARGCRRKGRILKQGLSVNGYYHVDLYKNGKGTIKSVHRLVAQHFCENYSEDLFACHNDGVKTNNYYTNIRCDTPKNNTADRVKHGTFNTGERVGTSILTDSKVISIVDDLNSGLKAKDIANKHSVTPETIYAIKVGKSWKHITKHHPITI